MVLNDYETLEQYEECAIIRDSISKYYTKYEKHLKNVSTPRSLEQYKDHKHQKMLHKYNIIVEDKLAREKANLIKQHFPIKQQ